MRGAWQCSPTFREEEIESTSGHHRMQRPFRIQPPRALETPVHMKANNGLRRRTLSSRGILWEAKPGPARTDEKACNETRDGRRGRKKRSKTVRKRGRGNPSSYLAPFGHSSFSMVVNGSRLCAEIKQPRHPNSDKGKERYRGKRENYELWTRATVLK
jgi:hypothetical protein